jgi:hypothetical protein
MALVVLSYREVVRTSGAGPTAAEDPHSVRQQLRVYSGAHRAPCAARILD